MNRTTKTIALAGVISCILSTSAQANELTISGTLNKLTSGALLGTTFDQWKLNIQTSGNFTVDVKAYEASQSSTTTAGYYAADINGDGELTWLDTDSYFYHDTGLPLAAADAIVRCDDTANNCAVYQNGLTAATSPIVVTTHQQSETSQDGSIHFRRDPWFDVNAAAGNYMFLMADFRLDPAEAAGGINTNDSFSAPTGFINPITDHADYQVKFSSDSLNFSLNGNTITVSQVPIPGAAWLFGSTILGWVARRKKFV